MPSSAEEKGDFAANSFRRFEPAASSGRALSSSAASLSRFPDIWGPRIVFQKSNQTLCIVLQIQGICQQ